VAVYLTGTPHMADAANEVETQLQDSTPNPVNTQVDSPPVAPPGAESAQTPPPPAPPIVVAPTAHDPVILSEAIHEFGISPDSAAAMSPAELNRTVILLAKQRAKFAPTQPATPAAPVPEPDFSLPADLKAKLAEFDPNLVQAIEHAGKAGVDRARRAEEQLAQVRQQQEGQQFAQRIAGEMSKLPGLGAGFVTPGTPEHWKREAVFNQLRVLGQSGVINNSTPPEVAVPMAFKMLFGGSTPTPTLAPTTPATPAAAPTPTARPTNRLNPSVDGGDVRAELAAIIGSKLDQYEDEDAAKESRNGRMRP
jgi:hypothetical protein